MYVVQLQLCACSFCIIVICGLDTTLQAVSSLEHIIIDNITSRCSHRVIELIRYCLVVASGGVKSLVISNSEYFTSVPSLEDSPERATRNNYVHAYPNLQYVSRVEVTT